ncbi:dGTP triphosphohydrolase [Planctomicrobium sp. SH527]|uniref:dGTP triphosphohydrolase n=1 Tax=Planctomicrobium sp. SH527 TaxID=3448123 RepID=UPI003F5C56CC
MPFRLTWDKLLSATRPSHLDRRSSAPSGQPIQADVDTRTEFEKDYDRIVFSAPFRRLARKTQVHPLAKNDHIHNRLTHSMEVASVGRSLATRLVEKLEQDSSIEGRQAREITWVTLSACLVHDLGNPPFGHAAEEAIRQWAIDHHQGLFHYDPAFDGKPLFKSEQQRLDVISDWRNFEGNANGFRFASRKDVSLISYLNLTHATLASTIKYPWTSQHPNATKTGKHNIYSTEREIFRTMSDDLGLTMPNGEVCRHPLSFLTEAADDICYRIIDLEDAVELKIESHENVRKLLCSIAEFEYRENMNLQFLRAISIGKLTNKLWSVFEADYERIMSGERQEDLKSSLDEKTKEQLAVIKEIYTNIFSHPKKIAMEIGCYHILGRLLHELLKTVRAIHMAESFENLPFIARRCAELAWTSEYTKENFNKDYSWWLSQMMDFVSGMTDDYAASLSSQITGHSYSDH